MSLNDRIRADRAEKAAEAANGRAEAAERRADNAERRFNELSAELHRVSSSYRELVQALGLTVQNHAANLPRCR